VAQFNADTAQSSTLSAARCVVRALFIPTGSVRSHVGLLLVAVQWLQVLLLDEMWHQFVSTAQASTSWYEAVDILYIREMGTIGTFSN